MQLGFFVKVNQKTWEKLAKINVLFEHIKSINCNVGAF